MIDFNSVALEVFQVIRAYGDDVVLYDANGNRVFEPNEARRFYSSSENTLVSISESGDDSAVSIFISESANIADMKDFIDTIRAICVRSNLLFHVRKSSREIKPHSFATRASLGEQENMNMNIMEGLYGTSRSSYLRLENAKMIVRHSEKVRENMIGSRGRNIQSIFVENSVGERFLFPTQNLYGARAMTQHVNQGGTFADEVGQQIIRMAQDFKNLASVATSLKSISSDSEANNVRESVVVGLGKQKYLFGRLFNESSYASACLKLKEASALNESDDFVTKVEAVKAILGEGFTDEQITSVAKIYTPKDTSVTEDTGSEPTVKAIKVKFPSSLPDSAVWEFIESQNIVTIEGFTRTGDDVYLEPHFGQEYDEDTVDALVTAADDFVYENYNDSVLGEGGRGTFRAGSRSYFNAGRQASASIAKAAAARRAQFQPGVEVINTMTNAVGIVDGPISGYYFPIRVETENGPVFTEWHYDSMKLVTQPVSEETDTEEENFLAWQEAVKAKHPGKVFKFVGRQEGATNTVSAEVPGEDRSYGVWYSDDAYGDIFELDETMLCSNNRDIKAFEDWLGEFNPDSFLTPEEPEPSDEYQTGYYIIKTDGEHTTVIEGPFSIVDSAYDSLEAEDEMVAYGTPTDDGFDAAEPPVAEATEVDVGEMTILQRMKHVLKTKHGHSDADFAGLSFHDIERMFLDDAGESDFR